MPMNESPIYANQHLIINRPRGKDIKWYGMTYGTIFVLITWKKWRNYIENMGVAPIGKAHGAKENANVRHVFGDDEYEITFRKLA